MKNDTSIKFCIVTVLLFAYIGCENVGPALTADQLVAKGRQAYAEGQIENAVDLYKRAIKLSPSSSVLHFELGYIYYEEWRKSRAVAQNKLLQEFITERSGKTPLKVDNEKLLIQNGYRKEYYALALLEFSEVLKSDPSHWRARYYIAADLFNNKKYEAAIDEFNKLIKLKPDYANNYSFLGEAYLKTGKYQLAINTLEKALDLHPVANHYYVLGQAYKKTNNWKKVDEMVKKLKEMNSDYADNLR